MSGYHQIVIVGLGVVGGSFAKAIRQAFPQQWIGAIDCQQDTLDVALAQGWIDAGDVVGEQLIATADLVILCLYPEASVQFIARHRQHFKTGATVTDVVGVKQGLLSHLAHAVPTQVNLILGHPMAGREQSGFAYASAEVFQGANYLLTPTAYHSAAALDQFAQFIRQLGFARVTETTPKRHDEMIAYTSQLSHVLAVSLINSEQLTDDTINFIGDSYRDLTRIANMNAPLWAELFLTNQEALLTAIDQFEEQLQRIKQAVVSKDEAQLQVLFRQATARRQQLAATDYKQR